MQGVFSQYADPNDTSDPTVKQRHRRRRDGLACAECRRLKLKCNRAWPCETCIRRGCAAVCPTGSLAPGKAGRLILANTSTLHERIASLSERIRSLEDFVEQTAGPSHPLLAEALRDLKAPLQGEPFTDTNDADKDGEHRTTMQARQDAATSKNVTSTTSEVPQPVLTLGELIELGRTFPQSVDEEDLADTAKTIEDIKSFLPALPEANAEAERFYGGYGGLFSPVPNQMFTTLLHELYAFPPGRSDIDYVHKLALVFLTFALANFSDTLSLEGSSTSEKYFHLAKALYSIRSCIDSTNVWTVMGMMLFAIYCRLSSRNSTTWTVLGIVAKLIIGNNLHRDPAHYGVDVEGSASRRFIFWEIFSFDTFYTFCVQRAPLYNVNYIDCPFPDIDLGSEDPAARMTANCDLWKYRYTSEVVPKVMEETIGRKVVTYTSVLEVDKLIRESWVPECLQADQDPPTGLDAVGMATSTLQRHTIQWYRELALMFLHRPLLAIALTEKADDPLQHRFSQSVLASFRSAYTLCNTLRVLATDPLTHGTRSCYFQPGFAAITVLASIAILVPHSGFSQAACTEALATCELYENETIPVPPKVMAWIIHIKQKLQQHQQGAPPVLNVCAPDWDQFGADAIHTRALTSQARKEASFTVPIAHTQPVVPTHRPPPGSSDDLWALRESLDASLLMNEPIASDYFPPVDVDVVQEPPPVPLNGLWPVDYTNNNPQQYMGTAAIAPSSDMDGDGQWERFLASVGLAEQP
ncbi:hypothetical protein EXIGLDRAFT_828923 [Exidia glandulosa HHB12029]|uniref:Zn(2)-C6 fungal-type domain-containing protein n=1 Tax=Exidia glandulosa HHB12029 TaxID=1314781 RepID=A0A165PX64_EXIGL|nr:hypothetical protein EXIGLDRAFT_828923 [Exidia glandulosa HHB12029]